MYAYNGIIFLITKVQEELKHLLPGKLLEDWQELMGHIKFISYGLSDLNITDLIKFHKAENRKATLTIFKPPCIFGELSFQRGRVLSFKETPEFETSEVLLKWN